jgi:hypothetical protein
MENIPKRDSDKYLEIERFHDFEFTECVAWEMAIRNDNVKSLLSKLNDTRKHILQNYFYGTDDGRIINTRNSHSDNRGSVDILDHLNEGVFCEEAKKKIALWEHDGKLNEAVGHYTIAEIKDLKNTLNDFENKFKAIFPDKTKIKYTKTFLFSHKELVELINLANDFFMNYETLKNDYYILFNDYLSIYEQLKKTITNTQKVSWKNENGEWIPSNITTKDNQQIDTNLLPERSRPSLNIPSEISNTLELSINLNLPLKEISSYIEQLQQVYKEDKKLIRPSFAKSKGKNKILLHRLKEKIIYGNNKVAQLKNVFADQETMATMFYIYDCRKEGFSFSAIKNGLFNASDSLTTSDAEKTLKQYYATAEYYIDNKHYKELITGYSVP